MAENDLTQQASIRALAHLAEMRDPETGNHLLRTQGYVRELAQRLRRHPRFAATLTDSYIELLGRSAPLKWDGSGYPDGLAGEAIPVSARLMAVADVFDALISARVYKAAMSYPKAREIMAAGRAQHFDPDVVDAFLQGFDAFVGIARQHLDEAEALQAAQESPAHPA